MSRRSRKSGVAKGNRWMGKLVVGLLAALILGLIVAYLVTRNYLRSDGFRRLLSSEVGKMAGVDGEFAPFRWQGLAVDTEYYEARGAGPMTGLRVDGLHTQIGLGRVLSGVWEVRDSNVRRLDVSMNLKSLPHDTLAGVVLAPSVASSAPKAIKKRDAAWFPSKVEVKELDVQELVAKIEMDSGLLSVAGVSLKAEQAESENSYRLGVRGGSVRLPLQGIPVLQLDQAKLRNQDGRVYLTDATIKAWENGRIQGSGEWEVKTRHFSLEGDITGLKCDELLNETWAKRMTGDVGATLVFHNDSGFPQASGSLTLQNGVMTALPVLDVLAAYTDTRRFRVLSLSEARTDWSWKKSEMELKNLILASEGLVRLEGGMVIRGEALDGNFRLGIAPGILSNIPGAEEDVFHVGERGLLWASVRITGTVDNMKEDLTERLILAAGMRVFDQLPGGGEKVMKFTHSLLQDSSPKAVEKSTKIIEEGSKTLREVGGILDGILGGGRRKSQEPEIPAQ
jgi:hypothetical protein